jgi:PKD repeat protein
VQFEAEASSPGGRIREYFWDFGDESFSTRRAPAHVFDAAARQHEVCVTVIDDQGGSAYDVAEVSCSPR